MTTLKDLKAKRTSAPQIVSVFDGEPPTQILTDAKGRIVGVVITPIVLTPLRAKLADFLGGVSVIALSALGIGFVTLFNDPAPYWWFIAPAMPWPFGVLMQKGFRRLLRKRTVLMFSPEHFAVRGQRHPYDRQQPHRFRIDNGHPQAEKEAEKHQVIQERARMQGKIVRPAKYHRDTYCLYFDYGNQPRKVMEIMGVEDARLVLGRVATVDDLMDQVEAMGDVLVTGPKSEWDDMAGKIPEKA